MARRVLTLLSGLAATSLASLAALALGVAPAGAQQASYGQYLVVIDDSGSMNDNDPRRLVVMASLALAGALEDGDQVMLVGLNELASGEVSGPSFVSPSELLAGRDGAQGSRRVSGGRVTRLEQHDGQTPCRGALDRARSILNAVASAGAPQTLLMLTDGACNGGSVEAPDQWLSSLRSHAEHRFRFVLLMRAGRERADRSLSAYARQTGWTGEERVAFDARTLLRAFANVLSFSRGLRYDDGGRIGLERTFAGARSVRVLAIHEGGVDRIGLERVTSAGGSALTVGPTFRHPSHGWSLRVALDGPSETPYAVRTPTAGAEVLVIPVYGRLRVEGVVAPCGEPPPLPWNEERAVRAGQPACAWARLVGDRGETIHPTTSFAFDMDVCIDESCGEETAMQPAADGTFNAQLGAEFPIGRHQRILRAIRGALAWPVVQARGFSAMAFGVQRVTTADAPDRPLSELDVGELPKATSDAIDLVLNGAFPAGSRARVRCEVEGDEAVRSCVECSLGSDDVALQDPFRLQLNLRGTSFCDAVSSHGGRDLPVRMRVLIEPTAAEVGPHTIPIRAVLRYAAAEPVSLTVEGGHRVESAVSIPGPMEQVAISATVELDEDDLVAGAVSPSARVRAGDDRRASVVLFAEAEDCCQVGTHEGTLTLTPAGGGPALSLPIRVEVSDPGWWVCPGKQILKWTLIVVALILLIWVIRGFVSPAKFRAGAVLMWATSHDGLLSLRDGDDGFRKLDRFPETKRGFRRNGALWLGGPGAPLPSLKRMAADAHIEAQAGGGALLIVKGPGVEKFEESTGWTEIEPGQYPVGSRITLRRLEEVYLQFRR